MQLRILVADDNATIRALLKRVLEEHPGWEVCGEADNGQDAVTKTEQLVPDVVILDWAMPRMTGPQAALEISKAHPDLPMLLLTVQDVTEQLVQAAKTAGFQGAVSKMAGTEVVPGIEALLRHETFFCMQESASERSPRRLGSGEE